MITATKIEALSQSELLALEKTYERLQPNNDHQALINSVMLRGIRAEMESRSETQTPAQMRERIEQLEHELEGKDEEIDDAADAEAAALKKVGELSAKVENLQAELDALKAKHAA